MKELDFVQLRFSRKRLNIGIIKEVNTNGTFSVEWIGGCNNNNKTAWFLECELKVVDNLPNLLSRRFAHPFSSNKINSYPIE